MAPPENQDGAMGVGRRGLAPRMLFGRLLGSGAADTDQNRYAPHQKNNGTGDNEPDTKRRHADPPLG